MELSELIAYARDKYEIGEQHKWADFPGFSVLCHPQTGKWVALLMRQWDSETGVEIERCDIKSSSVSRLQYQRAYLSSPFRMRGSKWIGVCFDERTEPQVVFELLDLAFAAENPHGATIVLDSRRPAGEGIYRETPLSFAGKSRQPEKGQRPDGLPETEMLPGVLPEKEQLPEKLREMRHLYEYGRESAEAKARNFYRQAEFMKDYEDDCPWTGGSFFRYFPTYHDLTVRQLRGYFTWRTRLRKGIFETVPSSVAYLYVYELLNGVGVDTPEETIEKLKEFERGYLDSGIGDARMRPNLRRWMLEYAVWNDLPAQIAREAADPELLEQDQALAVLRSPQDYPDEDVFAALCLFGGKKTENSPVLKNDPERGRHLFCETWRMAAADPRQEKDLFTQCFGERKLRAWHPFANAVFYKRQEQKDRDYVLDDCRIFHCRNGIWQVESYEKLLFDRRRVQGFLHATDARLRRYLKTGRYLKEKPEDEWALPFIEGVIEAEKKALIEAARPKITIDLSGLEQIRRDAARTRDSLLTEDERSEIAAVNIEPEFKGITAAESESESKGITAVESEPVSSQMEGSEILPDPVLMQILRTLLEGGDAAGLIREYHLMPSIVADAINEAFYDEIGDTVLLCEGDALALVDDYIEDMEQILGGV